ncbi:hypothetical protein PR048_026471 [Dryococelus australis]|uniref:Uncharacterized protein n=1 Tax=Dryococelus australis TaxID=614101 RepID=A0ABQ9GLG5_9NEOP|nr:hypothetical protein PR048_026471 [Dryococelus australis]
MRLKPRSRDVTTLSWPRPAACCDTAHSSSQAASVNLVASLNNGVKIQIMLLGKCRVVVRLDVATPLVIQEIETREYLSTFFRTVLNSFRSFPSGLSFVKEKISRLDLEHKLEGPALNPGATPSVKKYNLPSSDRVDAELPGTVTSNPCTVQHEAKRREASLEETLSRDKQQTIRETATTSRTDLPNDSHDNTSHNIEIQRELGSGCYRKYCNGTNEDTEREVTVMDEDTLNESFYERDESEVDSCNESDDIDGGEVDSYDPNPNQEKNPEKYFNVAWSCLLALLKI